MKLIGTEAILSLLSKPLKPNSRRRTHDVN